MFCFFPPLSLSAGTRCRLFHVVHEDPRGQRDLSSSPFCFSALQDSWSEQRLLAASSSASGPRDFNTFVFSAISVK